MIGRMMLGRTLNPATMCWESLAIVPIPVEVMDHIDKPKCSFLDLFYVLTIRDELHDNWKVHNLEAIRMANERFLSNLD